MSHKTEGKESMAHCKVQSRVAMLPATPSLPCTPQTKKGSITKSTEWSWMDLFNPPQINLFLQLRDYITVLACNTTTVICTFHKPHVHRLSFPIITHFLSTFLTYRSPTETQSNPRSITCILVNLHKYKCQHYQQPFNGNQLCKG